MSGLQKIYVDFSIRDPDGRFYRASLKDFAGEPQLADEFIGTDFDEFEVVCEIVAIDRLGNRVYHRPVDPSAVPGSAPRLAPVAHDTSSHQELQAATVDAGLVVVG